MWKLCILILSLLLVFSQFAVLLSAQSLGIDPYAPRRTQIDSTPIPRRPRCVQTLRDNSCCTVWAGSAAGSVEIACSKGLQKPAALKTPLGKPLLINKHGPRYSLTHWVYFRWAVPGASKRARLRERRSVRFTPLLTKTCPHLVLIECLLYLMFLDFIILLANKLWTWWPRAGAKISRGFRRITLLGKMIVGKNLPAMFLSISSGAVFLLAWACAWPAPTVCPDIKMSIIVACRDESSANSSHNSHIFTFDVAVNLHLYRTHVTYKQLYRWCIAHNGHP
ncbi:hypothetical protein C8R45DRAFT_922821 [Mycena sanguinolenta]|nr:hypothetical protein C8R45DRAFT_922821 [Mycena sanguinolenta]